MKKRITCKSSVHPPHNKNMTNTTILTYPTIEELRAGTNHLSIFLLDCYEYGYISWDELRVKWLAGQDAMRDAVKITNKFKSLGGEI